ATKRISATASITAMSCADDGRHAASTRHVQPAHASRSLASRGWQQTLHDDQLRVQPQRLV
ncbi:MAG: hypothetical protein M3253_09420, partial [Chloroflexota bacterium]|nr:hypothetical protein [Chloroflexota bacterium]